MDPSSVSRYLQHAQQQQQSQRPQSLRIVPPPHPPVAIPLLQSLQQITQPPRHHPPFFYNQISTSSLLHQHNNIPSLPTSAANSSQPQTQNPSSTSRGVVAGTLPVPISSGCEKPTKQQQHPQIWCGKGHAEPAESKLVYNYAQRKDSMEKTPMCRVAELARCNKLRHEYVLLDESGPAHKKKFTVKLILCPGQEFEGSGPSIKKAQQAAAQCAIESTTLPKAQQNRGIRRNVKKDEQNNPIVLLNTVAVQLGINVQYREEAVRQPFSFNPAATAMPKPINPLGFPGYPPSLTSTFCYAPSPAAMFSTAAHNQYHPYQSPQLSPNKALTSILDLSIASMTTSPMMNGAANFPLQFPSFPPLLGNNFSLLGACLSMPSTAQIPPLFLSGTSLNGPSLLGPSPMQNILSYKVTITLGLDGSEHVGTGANLSLAKQKAATLALAYLKPQLETFKQAKAEGHTVNEEQQQKLGDPDDRVLLISSPQSGKSSSSPENEESSSPDAEEEEGEDIEENGYEEHTPTGEDGNKSGNIAGKEERRQRKKSKSVVSQIHECALRLRMNVEFEVLTETGEPHNRIYTLQCRLISPSTVAGGRAKEFLAEGQGPSKKAAKQAACQKLLEQIRRLLDNDPIQLASQIARGSCAAQRRGANGLGQGIGGGAKEFAKRKTIIKDKKMDPEYGHHINPISRLIQVMQVRQEREPAFQLLAEQGQHRHREFVCSVQCMGLEEHGTGPNKKLAKRAAAEAMLARIGYVKPMPLPGKSLLKKSSMQHTEMDSFMEIGHFDVNATANDDITVWNGGECQQQSNANKSNNCHRGGMADSLATFADVEQALQQAEAATTEEEEELGKQYHNSGGQWLPNSAVVVADASQMDEEDASPTTKTPSPTNAQQQEVSAVRSQRRRVTFSEHVSACPPPEDSNYPMAQIAPLKSELGGKLKRRSRDSQRMLSLEEAQKLAAVAKQFLSWRNAEHEKRGLIELEYRDNSQQQKLDGLEPLEVGIEAAMETKQQQEQQKPVPMMPLLTSPPPSILAPPQLATQSANSMPFLQQSANKHVLPMSATGFPTPLPLFGPPPLPNCSMKSVFDTAQRRNSMEELANGRKFALVNAKTFLDHLAKQFKFTVAYSDFPKTKNASEEEQCFTLLTLGLSKPIVCHGSGLTEADAHNDAAFNAIRNSLNTLDSCTSASTA